MKTFILFIYCLISLSLFSQKSQLAFYAPFDSPVKSVMPSMRTNFGIGFSYAYRPYSLPIMGEVKVSFGHYATNGYSQYYYFGQSYKPTNVTFKFKSKMNKYLFGVKYHIGYDFRTLRGFVTPQFGFVTFKSKNSHTYPTSNSSSNSNSQSGNYLAMLNATAVYGGEMGLELDLNALFKKSLKQTIQHHIFISTSFYKGLKEVKYTNVNNLQSVSEGIDPDSGIILEDHSTYVAFNDKVFTIDKLTNIHTSKFLMWGIHIGYIINIGNPE